MNIRLPDAIHAATAITTNCNNFITHDKHLENLSDLNVILISKYI
jgi:predicted nucleic acid-binding protein